MLPRSRSTVASGSLAAVTWQRRDGTPSVYRLDDCRPWEPPAQCTRMPSRPPSRSKVDGSGTGVEVDDSRMGVEVDDSRKGVEEDDQTPGFPLMKSKPTLSKGGANKES